MRIDSIHIKGFRNFADCKIKLDSHALIVGENDIGKSNLLYALRLLFDPSFSSRDFELNDDDFNMPSESSEVVITVKVTNINEECLISIFKAAISDDRTVYIRFYQKKNDDYVFLTGPTLEALEESSSRYYIKHLQMEYVGSTRDLSHFLRRKQNRLLAEARSQRSDEDEQDDQTALASIQEGMDRLNDQINGLHYLSNSLNVVNKHMIELSSINDGYQMRFVSGSTDAGMLVDNLKLAFLSGNAPLTFGGDGRRNQMYFATWLSQQKLVPKNRREKIVFFAVEEPEAHLHPHQQRRLSEYLSLKLDTQILMTTHSPQILAHFTNGTIIRLTKTSNLESTKALTCSTEIDEALDKFGYRLNSITSEVFFSRGVLLVEGPSEMLLYTALSGALDLDLDHLNLSIISVKGIGFKKYIDVCLNLEIPFVVRTDNDVFKVPKKKDDRRWYRYAGVARAADLLVNMPDDRISEEVRSTIKHHETSLVWEGDCPTEQNNKAADILRKLADDHDIHLAIKDLENDLANGPLHDQLAEYYCEDDTEEIVKQMQERKAENMYNFLKSKPDLSPLGADRVARPLLALVRRIQNADLTEQ
jgi:hypothetical protein